MAFGNSFFTTTAPTATPKKHNSTSYAARYFYFDAHAHESRSANGRPCTMKRKLPGVPGRFRVPGRPFAARPPIGRFAPFSLLVAGRSGRFGLRFRSARSSTSRASSSSAKRIPSVPRPEYRPTSLRGLMRSTAGPTFMRRETHSRVGTPATPSLPCLETGRASAWMRGVPRVITMCRFHSRRKTAGVPAGTGIHAGEKTGPELFRLRRPASRGLTCRVRPGPPV